MRNSTIPNWLLAILSQKQSKHATKWNNDPSLARLYNIANYMNSNYKYYVDIFKKRGGAVP